MSRKKRSVPGSREALEELHYAKYRLALACRLVQLLVRNSTGLIKQCERYGSVSNFSQQINETAVNISRALQDVNRAGNSAIRSLKRFNNVTKGN